MEYCLLDQTVVSSHDRINDKIAMMRQVECKETKRSIFYTGQCDSLSKAREQELFLLETEMEKPFQNLKRRDQGEGFTYIVNNLISSHGIGQFGISIFAGFNERKSILNERKVLEQLRPLKVGGKRAFLNPIYFNQVFNFLTFFGVPNLQKEIHQRGYRSLPFSNG